jgi:hypothetical protein
VVPARHGLVYELEVHVCVSERRGDGRGDGRGDDQGQVLSAEDVLAPGQHVAAYSDREAQAHIAIGTVIGTGIVMVMVMVTLIARSMIMIIIMIAIVMVMVMVMVIMVWCMMHGGDIDLHCIQRLSACTERNAGEGTLGVPRCGRDCVWFPGNVCVCVYCILIKIKQVSFLHT